MKSRTAIIIVLIAFGFVPHGISADVPHYVATTTVLQDIVKNVVGDKAVVDTLMDIGVDPHDYQPSAEDSSKLQDADFVFFFGGGVEEVLSNTLDTLLADGKAFSVTDALPKDVLLPSDEQNHAFNPHVWMDPTIMQIAVSNITDVLVERDPANGATYLSNGANYISELSNLHNSTLIETNKIPEGQRFLVTQHNAFSYWTERYNFEYRSLEGISTTDEVSLKEIDNLAKYLKDNEIKVIYLETTVPDTQAQAVIQATEAIGWKVGIGGTLFSGSLGEGNASTYIGMMSTNARTIVEGILNPPANAGSVQAPFQILSGIFAFAIIVLSRRKHRKQNE